MTLGPLNWPQGPDIGDLPLPLCHLLLLFCLCFASHHHRRFCSTQPPDTLWTVTVTLLHTTQSTDSTLTSLHSHLNTHNTVFEQTPLHPPVTAGTSVTQARCTKWAVVDVLVARGSRAAAPRCSQPKSRQPRRLRAAVMGLAVGVVRDFVGIHRRTDLKHLRGCEH